MGGATQRLPFFMGLSYLTNQREQDKFRSTAAGTAVAVVNADGSLVGNVTISQGSTPWVVVGNATGGLADSGNPLKVGGVYFSTATIYADGNRVPLLLDVNGNLKVTLATLLAGEDLTNDVQKVENRFSYTSFTSLSTINIKSATGFLHRIVIGMPSCPTTIVYDSLTPSGSEIFRFHAGYPVGSYEFNETFSIGLTLDTVKSGGGVNPYFNIAYR